MLSVVHTKVPNERKSAEGKHSGGIAGHFGHDKTFAQLKSSYYWLGMREKVKKFVKICKIFQYAK
jgi:hypothetical protein